MADEFPYFLPLQYLNWLHEQEDRTPLILFKEINPANIVLLHSFIHSPIENQVAVSLDETGVLENELEYATLNTDDYFANQGVSIAHGWPEKETFNIPSSQETEADLKGKEQSLMVVMSFTEWLAYLQSKTEKAREEEEGQKALKAMWQKQKLAEALEEENEEIPEAVFEMAVNSIMPEEALISESLAEVYAMQDKKEKAIEIYKKLSLWNPEKNGYFAQKIKNLQKETKI